MLHEKNSRRIHPPRHWMRLTPYEWCPHRLPRTSFPGDLLRAQSHGPLRRFRQRHAGQTFRRKPRHESRLVLPADRMHVAVRPARIPGHRRRRGPLRRDFRLSHHRAAVGARAGLEKQIEVTARGPTSLVVLVLQPEGESGPGGWRASGGACHHLRSLCAEKHVLFFDCAETAPPDEVVGSLRQFRHLSAHADSARSQTSLA